MKRHNSENTRYDSREIDQDALTQEEADALCDEVEADFFAGSFTLFVDFLITKGMYPECIKLDRDVVFKRYCEHQGIEITQHI